MKVGLAGWGGRGVEGGVGLLGAGGGLLLRSGS